MKIQAVGAELLLEAIQTWLS